ncbi:hypothetical protein, conserved [Leishmania tarentolae]|uniref:Uncharacterized protein n=1 Tax=Leishmania tarentolae TaxID=5689 RepID=A0A640KPQ0_LEITA|nr:hypothetical protein, conserved [Leishmania tarentolae]
MPGIRHDRRAPVDPLGRKGRGRRACSAGNAVHVSYALCIRAQCCPGDQNGDRTATSECVASCSCVGHPRNKRRLHRIAQCAGGTIGSSGMTAGASGPLPLSKPLHAGGGGSETRPRSPVEGNATTHEVAEVPVETICAPFLVHAAPLLLPSLCRLIAGVSSVVGDVPDRVLADAAAEVWAAELHEFLRVLRWGLLVERDTCVLQSIEEVLRSVLHPYAPGAEESNEATSPTESSVAAHLRAVAGTRAQKLIAAQTHNLYPMTEALESVLVDAAAQPRGTTKLHGRWPSTGAMTHQPAMSHLEVLSLLQASSKVVEEHLDAATALNAVHEPRLAAVAPHLDCCLGAPLSSISRTWRTSPRPFDANTGLRRPLYNIPAVHSQSLDDVYRSAQAFVLLLQRLNTHTSHTPEATQSGQQKASILANVCAAVNATVGTHNETDIGVHV